ncbi:hypothetical protein D6D20_05253 [Aureobasidium pullulans]|uniref:Dystroglycan-type cadherin-like domain-containing protein n=1 Tax=Aureobasidium pullulans TaxID=5580 RepID=A0A4V4L6D7_AURPU|nr:hypothetical protein D6D20_05253 [Aureobasidium pullulans]TIA03737.1 hypothetical protein D6C82_01587 [Aureobasidium pullulans]
MRGLLFSVLFNTLASALPQVAFPFNSQVPSVARANEAYAFQLAPTTFVSGDGSTLVYSLLSAPAWLSLESTTRTLYGTPGQGNTGPNVFKIVATGNDGSANMDCTLVVASNRAPTLAGNISSDLARSGPLSGPTTLLLQPSTAFAITFPDDLFGDPGTIKSYYATMADRTPLPSWLKFDSSSLTFWGMTPVLVTGSQTYGVDFIASDVAGFAGATTTFSLLISSNQLAFDTQTENITVTPEESVTLGPFRRQLQINGGQVSDSQIQRAVAKAPEWLTFQNSSLELKGTPPQDFTSQTISITVTDTYGDTAVKNIFLRSANASLFDHKIGNLTATAGKPFSYTLAPSLFSQSDLDIELDVGDASSWLAYDASKRQLEGTPPATAKASANTMTLIASSASDSETQTFFINLKAAAIVGSPSTSQATTSTTPIPTSTSLPSVTSSAAPSKDRSMTAGIIVGIVIGCLAVLALFFAIAMLCCRRRRKQKQPRKKIEKGDIRPIVPYGDQEPMMVEHNHDEEKFIGSPVKHSPDEPPQLEVDLPMPMQPPVKPRHFLGGRDARQKKRRSIRLVSRSESVVDRRPLAEKRQSFIRNRASSGVMSPVLFASSRRSSNMGLYSNLGSIKGSPSVRRQTTSSSLLEPPARNPRRLVSGPHIFPPGLPRAITPSPVRATNNNSPTLPPANTADNWTTTDTSSSLSRDNSDARAAAQYAGYAVEMELPRHQRTWVRPGEASPTPPPSSILRTASNSREAARRKWADRLNRNSSGNLASRSPSPLRVTLSGVSASGIKGRKQRLKSKFDEDKENRDEDQLSKLVSNDSFSGARQMRGRKSLVQVEAGNRISSSMAKVEETGDKNKANTDDTEWEDAVENVPQGHGISAV